MSLRHYLFTLIGLLILLLAAAQWSLVYWIDRQITAEVNEQAQALSEKVIEFAFNSEGFAFSTDGESQVTLFTENASVNEQGGNRVVVLPQQDQENVRVIKELITVATDGAGEIEELHLDENKKVIIKKRLDKVFEQINAEQSAGPTDPTSAPEQNSSGPERFLFEHTVETSATTQDLIYSIQAMIIISALVAVGFAYWLSAQFNRPLNELKNGFNALAIGDYGHQIAPQGVADIKATMGQFNEMSANLAQLKEAEQHYKESAHLAELGEVSRGLAHTLRNPIHTIGLSIEQIGSEDLSEADKHVLIEKIQSKIRQLDSNIKSLLTLTTTGIARTEQVPILAVVQDIVLEYKFAQLKPHQFEIDIPATLSIVGAESEIRNILHTLIVNACEAMPEPGSIQIAGTSDGDVVEVTVIDQGVGLSDDIKANLFKPHVSSKSEGAGMGLYIAKRIIGLHYQGDITLENVQPSSVEQGLAEHGTTKHASENEMRNYGCCAKARFVVGGSHE